MKNITKLLLNDEEMSILKKTTWFNYVKKHKKNDPDYGFSGSGDFTVVYFDQEMTPNQLLYIGMEIQKKLTK